MYCDSVYITFIFGVKNNKTGNYNFPTQCSICAAIVRQLLISVYKLKLNYVYNVIYAYLFDNLISCFPGMHICGSVSINSFDVVDCYL